MSSLNLLTPTIFNQISNLYAQLLAAELQTHSTTNCTIAIGTINGSLNSNCNVLISNICGAEQNSLVLFDLAFSKIVSLVIPGAQQVDLLAAYNSLRSNCVAQAALTQNITVNNINLGTCSSTTPLYFNFINSGDATSNCVISGILSGALENVNSTASAAATDPLLTYVQDNFLYFALGFIGIAAAFAFYRFTQMLRTKKTIIYRKTE